MRFTRTLVVIVASSIVVGASVACAQRVEGCTPPADEDRLLDTYERDPVMRVADNRIDDEYPTGIRRRAAACRLNPDTRQPTITTAYVQYFPQHSYDGVALAAAFDQAATRGGWTRVPRQRKITVDGFGRERSTDDYAVWSQYCARPNRTLSTMMITATQPQAYSSGLPEGTSSGWIMVDIRVAQPEDPTCP